MIARFKHDGLSIDYVPDTDVTAGDVIVLNDLIGIAKFDIAAGDLGSLALAGVYEMPKAVGASTAIDTGEPVYWDEDEQVAKTDAESGANKLLGKVIADSVDDDDVVLVRLTS